MHGVRNSPWNPILFALPNKNYYLRMRGRERERYREERDWWNPVYKPVLRISPLLYVAFSICASLFLFSLSLLCVYLLSFSVFAFFLRPLLFFACWRLSIYREVWETTPTFFRSSTDRLIGNIHGPLSFFTCSCHPPLFSLLVCFVSRIFFS